MTMQTWLDWYVSGSSISYRRACERFPGVVPGTDLETHRRAMTDDAFAFRLSVESSAYALARVEDDTFAPPIDAAMENAIWRESLSPFFMDTGKIPLAIALDRGVIRELGDARVSSNVRDYAREVVERFGAIYLDVAPRSIVFGDSLQLCALFIGEAEGGMRLWAVFGEPGRYGVRRMAWIEGHDGSLTDQYDDEALRVMMGSDTRPVMPSFADVARASGADLTRVQRSLEDFAALAVTYALTEMENAGGQVWPALPHLPAGHERRTGRKARAVVKKYSLFRVWQVSARRLEQGSRKPPVGAWKLGHRVTVSGHYRLQPFGKGRLQRRLRWIESHERGPVDGLPVRVIVRAGAENNREIRQAAA
jgi:hypothetical protein